VKPVEVKNKHLAKYCKVRRAGNDNFNSYPKLASTGE
jgi:hypothetical protein